MSLNTYRVQAFLSPQEGHNTLWSSPLTGCLAWLILLWHAASPWVEPTVGRGLQLLFTVWNRKHCGCYEGRNKPDNSSSPLTITEQMVQLLFCGSQTKPGFAPNTRSACALNEHLRVFKFRMLTLPQLLHSVDSVDWFSPMDVTAAYLHMPFLQLTGSSSCLLLRAQPTNIWFFHLPNI